MTRISAFTAWFSLRTRQAQETCIVWKRARHNPKHKHQSELFSFSCTCALIYRASSRQVSYAINVAVKTRLDRSLSYHWTVFLSFSKLYWYTGILVMSRWRSSYSNWHAYMSISCMYEESITKLNIYGI